MKITVCVENHCRHWQTAVQHWRTYWQFRSYLHAILGQAYSNSGVCDYTVEMIDHRNTSLPTLLGPLWAFITDAKPETLHEETPTVLNGSAGLSRLYTDPTTEIKHQTLSLTQRLHWTSQKKHTYSTCLVAKKLPQPSTSNICDFSWTSSSSNI